MMIVMYTFSISSSEVESFKCDDLNKPSTLRFNFTIH